jgi:hypothetical protein
LAAARLACGHTRFIGIKAGVCQRVAPVALDANVSKECHLLPIAFNFKKAGIIPDPLAAVADNPPMVHDNAGESRRLMPAGFNDDISRRGFTHGNLLEAFVVQERIPKNGRAQHVSWLCSQHDSLFCRLCEDDGYRCRVFRGARK